MFRRILVAIDGSPHAERALAEAADLAAAANSTLTVMTVVPDMSNWNLGGAGFGAYVPIQTLEDLREQTEREYQGMFDAAVETLPSDLSLTKVVDHGRPASAIVDRAVRDNRDLSVMGSRGRNEIKSLLLGSVSHDVLQTSPVPVLVVQAQVPEAAG
jgi:nucleotide-binding universal stress UspA family protein